MIEYQTYDEWVKSMNFQDTQPQEQPMSETTQELPAVAKLREAFDTARNAIIDGSELAKQVAELSRTVSSLNSEVSLLQRDLEYIRNRNKELDEQVTSVRQARDEAIEKAKSLQNELYDVDSRRTQAEARVQDQVQLIDTLHQRIDGLSEERDDAVNMALEYESKLKAAEAKLAKIEEVFDNTFSTPNTNQSPNKPTPHYLEQPRDEVGKFQPFDEPKNYGSGSQGSF